MGADYMQGRAQREKKGWRDGLDRMKQPRLDDRLPPDPARIVKFAARPQSSLRVGENLVLQSRGEDVCAYSGLALVAETHVASQEIRRAIESTHGLATGRVCSIDRQSGALEIVIDSATNIKRAS